MWESAEAQQKLAEIRSLTDKTLRHLQLVRARGTQADRALATGLGIEVLVGLNETYEFDNAFRVRIRSLAERWHAFQGDFRDLNRMFASVLMALERFKILVT